MCLYVCNVMTVQLILFRMGMETKTFSYDYSHGYFRL